MKNDPRSASKIDPPQQVEQRIGRCHRYGQKHDVVVVNFLNQNNAADQRVFQLLAEKFSLFEGVFGASDEVLGAIESGVDFEKRIAKIYQNCRSQTEIDASSDQLEQRKTSILREGSERNAAFFEAEASKIDSWADDLKVGLEREIKEFDRQIKEARRSAVSALTLEEKLEVQKQIRHLESQRNTKRRALFEAQDEIDSKREVLITEIEGKLQRKESILKLFVIRWGLV